MSGLKPPVPDRVYEGGDLDCGSGLALLLRQEMLKLAEGQVLELRSREPTVADDLPPWCRLTGHELLGTFPGEGDETRYFLRRGVLAEERERAELEQDRARARAYEWRIRARSTGARESTVYCRNFQWTVGQPASFEERDRHPSAVEQLLGALSGALATGFATECARDHLEVDDIEITARATLHDYWAHLGESNGDPGLRAIELKCFASTNAPDEEVKAAWSRALGRSPIAATLGKAAELRVRFAIV